MASKRPAEDLDNTSPAKKQKLENGVNATTEQPKAALPTMDKIAKAKKALELSKQLQAKLAAAKLKVQMHSCTPLLDPRRRTQIERLYTEIMCTCLSALSCHVQMHWFSKFVALCWRLTCMRCL